MNTDSVRIVGKQRSNGKRIEQSAKQFACNPHCAPQNNPNSMLDLKDIKGYFRDLVYIQEDAITQVRAAGLPKKEEERIVNTLQKKQIIITKIIDLLVKDNA